MSAVLLDGSDPYDEQGFLLDVRLELFGGEVFETVFHRKSALFVGWYLCAGKGQIDVLSGVS
jgi:hypothetical protein